MPQWQIAPYFDIKFYPFNIQRVFQIQNPLYFNALKMSSLKDEGKNPCGFQAGCVRFLERFVMNCMVPPTHVSSHVSVWITVYPHCSLFGSLPFFIGK